MYLHRLSDGISYLDHKLTPEVRAMLAAMASRLPLGGVEARYNEIVMAVAEGLWKESDKNPFPYDSIPQDFREALRLRYHQADKIWQAAESSLTEYPLPAKVQTFFDEFVGRYGHSSIMEQVGDPAMYVEGVSWFTNWLLFDSPLVTGQEFSTRAVAYKHWPMARECTGLSLGDDYTLGLDRSPHPSLERLHEAWLQVFEAEVEWWKEHLKDPQNRAALGIGDKEPFRPALDRARWALPGSIATGACFTSNLRERSRTIGNAVSLGALPHWEALKDAYRAASPGIAPYAFKEGKHSTTPEHLRTILTEIIPNKESVIVTQIADQISDRKPRRKGSYADPLLNRNRYRVEILCSLACARDWHRHRTLYPWQLFLVEGLHLDPHYKPMSEIAQKAVPRLLRESYALYRSLIENDPQRAALALPLGSQVQLIGEGGERDVLYMLELRASSHGSNFEYKDHAEEGLRLIEKHLQNRDAE